MRQWDRAPHEGGRWTTALLVLAWLAVMVLDGVISLIGG